jgi:hypothetical protein
MFGFRDTVAVLSAQHLIEATSCHIDGELARP